VPHPVIIDLNSLARRAIAASALEDLRTGAKPAGGIYGTLSMLLNILNQPDISADYIVACMDDGIPPWRLEALPEYKAHREDKRRMLTPEQQESVYTQLEDIRQLLPLLGVRVLRYEDREADDVVAAACRVFIGRGAVGPGSAPLVISGDRDLYQVMNYGQGVRVWDLGKKTAMTPAATKEVFGVPVQCWILYKALQGDASDNITGVPGIGEKTAAALIEAVSDLYTENTGGGMYTMLTPSEQLRQMLNIVEDAPASARKKYMNALLEQRQHLHTVLKAIDLTASFGPVGRFTESLLAPTPEIVVKDFLRYCRDLSFASVITDPKKWTRPYLTAEKFRASRPYDLPF